jgi:hypothetical protein
LTEALSGTKIGITTGISGTTTSGLKIGINKWDDHNVNHFWFNNYNDFGCWEWSWVFKKWEWDCD